MKHMKIDSCKIQVWVLYLLLLMMMLRLLLVFFFSILSYKFIWNPRKNADKQLLWNYFTLDKLILNILRQWFNISCNFIWSFTVYLGIRCVLNPMYFRDDTHIFFSLLLFFLSIQPILTDVRSRAHNEFEKKKIRFRNFFFSKWIMEKDVWDNWMRTHENRKKKI